eukprot:jgi/Botrbrau1/23408/Bobra.0051s0052.1
MGSMYEELRFLMGRPSGVTHNTLQAPKSPASGVPGIREPLWRRPCVLPKHVQRLERFWQHRPVQGIYAVDKPVRRKAARPTAGTEAGLLARFLVPTEAAVPGVPPVPAQVPLDAAGAPSRRRAGGAGSVGPAGTAALSGSRKSSRGFAPTFDLRRGLSRKQLELQRQAELDPVASPLDEKHLLDAAVFHDLVSSCNLKPSWRPKVTVFCRLGFTKRDLRVLSSVPRRRVFTALTAANLQRKLRLLREEAGMSDADLKRLLLLYPRIVEYKLESILQPHLTFLRSFGLTAHQIGKVGLRHPSLLAGLSLENNLEPRADLLARLAGVRDRTQLAKMVVRCPALLCMSEERLLEHVDFLRSLGLHPPVLSSFIMRHPQVFGMSLESLAERVDFLASEVGLAPDQLAAVLRGCPPVFWLKVESNLLPKWQYLQQHLGGTSSTLVHNPVYLSLSLSKRIIPRHRYMEKVLGPDLPDPFPISALFLTDAEFVEKWTGTHPDQYQNFQSRSSTSFG